MRFLHRRWLRILATRDSDPRSGLAIFREAGNGQEQARRWQFQSRTADADFEGGRYKRTLGPATAKRVPPPALLLAVCKGLDDMVELLIDRGADINVVDGNGATALARARELVHRAIVARLLAHGARQ
ncbi:ankyrin repeat domain-containing protein [Noviherbaspirillum sp. 1P10PC]|uniref:ankyrin repeat domain-containing protein n=1 Tax=Noviherbaspirillum sp. 1P10PC TaxID=3132292 RepID=UPI00399F2D74